MPITGQYARRFESFDDGSFDDESFDDGSFDDESWDVEAEFLSGIGSAIGGLAGAVAPAVGNLVGGLFGGKKKSPLPPVAVPVGAQGVSTATLQTPSGSATLRLPSAVVSKQEFDTAINRLEEGINRDTARVNSIQRDVETLRTRVGVVVTDTQRDLAKLRASTAKLASDQQSAIRRLRRNVRSQQTTNLMMTLLFTQRLQSRFEGHTHGTAGGTPVVGDGDDNNMMMMLPFLMMSPSDEGRGQGESSDNNMMMMMMAMMMAFGDNK